MPVLRSAVSAYRRLTQKCTNVFKMIENREKVAERASTRISFESWPDLGRKISARIMNIKSR